MPLLVSAVLFIILTTAISVYGYRKYAHPSRLRQRLSGAALESPAEMISAKRAPRAHPVLQWAHRIGRYVPISSQDAQLARHELIGAGYRSDKALQMLYGIKVVFALVLFLLALVVRDLVANPVLGVVLVIAGAFAGFSLPTFVLARLVSKRQEKLRLALPDALDLMVIAVEVGLGLDQALQTVGRELEITHKELSEELSLVNLEMRAGKRRAEALKNLAERTGEGEIRKLVAILIQSDRFGTSMGESLRVHSDYMRVRRRQEAEERAGKVGVKLVFPIFFFILPSMMVVAAGPGLLQIFKHLFPMMRNFGK